MTSVFATLSIVFLLLLTQASAIPTVIFHGIADYCSGTRMKNLRDQINLHTGEYTACIEIGTGVWASIFWKFKSQAEKACEKVNADSNFDGEFNVVGLS